jgi:hypothetical protein
MICLFAWRCSIQSLLDTVVSDHVIPFHDSRRFTQPAHYSVVHEPSYVDVVVVVVVFVVFVAVCFHVSQL